MPLTEPTPRRDWNDLTPRSRRDGARMTLDQFLALPDERPPLEWDNGVVLQKRSPRSARNVPHEAVSPAKLRHRLAEIEIPPDVAIEIVSPEQRVGDLLNKC